MTILKKALCNAPALKTFDISNGAGQIEMGVDTSFDGCGSILRQENKNNEWHLCCYECGLWNKAGNTYDPGKCERHWLVKPLMQIRNWVYGVRSLVETAANTLVHQLNLAANDLSGALPTS